MLDEDRNILDEIRDEFERLLKKIGDDYGIDMAYYDFRIEAIVKDSQFSLSDYAIIRDFEYSPCAFCGKPTLFYDMKRDIPVCASCYAKLEKNER